MRTSFLLITLLLFMSCQQQKTSENILFSSSRNGNSDIFFMNADGTNVTPVINTSYEEWGATFIDKDNITFLRQLKDSVYRFNFNLKTKIETSIPHPPLCYFDDKNAIYSKNGDYAFSCQLGIFLKKKDDSKFSTFSLGNRNKPNYLSWSFDGKSILYTDDLTGSNDVYAVHVETHKIDNLTRSDSNDERGDLSPDGNYLAFSSNRHNKSDQDIFILNLQTREVENISNSKGYDLIARWNLDGKSILYGSNKDGNWEIYSYTLEDKSTKRLTSNDAFDGDPRVR